MKMLSKLLTISVLFNSILMCYVNIASARTWQCSFKDGWTLNKDGTETSLSKGTFYGTREYLPPDRMLPLQTHGPMETQILEEMVYQPVATSLIGHAVVEIGSMTLSVSETLTDMESIITVIFHDGATKALVERNLCTRIE
jgi:hypothetical protein|tara:strand:- start:255 stop:677 length:423 start_codon:yes stop_codon:yes gene_type:complete